MKKSKNLRKVMSVVLALTLMLCTVSFSASASDTGYYNLQNIRKSATEYTAEQFKADLDAAATKYVFDAETVNYSGADLTIPDSKGILTSSPNWNAVPWGNRVPVSGSNYYNIGSNDKSVSYTFTSLGMYKPVAMGAVFVTRHDSGNLFNNNVTATVTYSNGATETKTVMVTSQVGVHDNTFYGFKAPVGTYITKYELTTPVKFNNTGVDDIGIIFDIVSATEYTRAEMTKDLSQTSDDFKAIVDFTTSEQTSNLTSISYKDNGEISLTGTNVQYRPSGNEATATSSGGVLWFSVSSSKSFNIDLSDDNVTAFGWNILSRNGAANIITMQATYDDNETSSKIERNISKTNGYAEFFGFEAPAGKKIKSIAITASDQWFHADDMWLIFEDDSNFRELTSAGTYVPVNDLAAFTGDLVGAYTYTNNTGVLQNVTLYMAKFGGSDNKTLIDVVKADAVPVAPGTGAKLTTPAMTITSAGGTYRLFVWNESLVPLADVLP